MPETLKSLEVHGALKGIRILDLTRILAGPTCTQLLGDLGADVIKIENPNGGDDTRTWGPPFVKDKEGRNTKESAYFLSSNRNKRSVSIDISKPSGAELVRQLAKQCDIFVENFKVGGLKKYKLSYQDISEELPRLIYCSITGFGQTGPNAKRPGYDILAQGYGGIMSLTGDPEGAPSKVGVGIADMMAGMYAATAILAAIHYRNLSGCGQHIDIALVDTQIAWLANEGTNFLLSGNVPVRRGNQHPNIVPYQVFEVSNGHVIVAVGNDSQFSKFCRLIGASELASDKKFLTNERRVRNRDILIPKLEALLKNKDKSELLIGMEQLSIPCGPIYNLEEVFTSDQVASRQMKIRMPHILAGSNYIELIGNPIKFSKSQITYDRSPPVCGADTKETICELLGERAYETALKQRLLE